MSVEEKVNLLRKSIQRHQVLLHTCIGEVVVLGVGGGEGPDKS